MPRPLDYATPSVGPPRPPWLLLGVTALWWLLMTAGVALGLVDLASGRFDAQRLPCLAFVVLIGVGGAVLLWQSVFRRNVAATSVALGIMSLLGLLSILSGVRDTMQMIERNPLSAAAPTALLFGSLSAFFVLSGWVYWRWLRVIEPTRETEPEP